MKIEKDIEHYFRDNFLFLLDSSVNYFKPKVLIVNVTLSFDKKYSTSRCGSKFLKFNLFFALFSFIKIYENGGGYYSEECCKCDKFNFYGTWEKHITSLISHELSHLFTFYFDLLKTPNNSSPIRQNGGLLSRRRKFHTNEWKNNYEIIKNLLYDREINKDTTINNKFILNELNRNSYEIIFMENDG